ncbi:glycosyltransferase family 4 protein [Gemmatimonas sp.]|uniref:glycosyltransferase family 4 protein n=1 Tax=Gemmatimonas sp. TaxID=1962908 RepID=UPI003983B1EF
MRESLRILLVHDYAPQYGGAEVVNAALTDALRRRGHHVRRFTSTAGFDALPGDSPLRPEYACRGTLSRWRTALQSANPWAPAALRRAIDDFKPDVVHVKSFNTQLSPLILPVLRSVPSLYHAEWYRAVCPTGLKLLPSGAACTARAGVVCLSSGCVPVRDWLPLMAQQRLLRRWRGAFRAIIANSNATAQHLRDDGMATIIVVPNGTPERSAKTVLADVPAVVFAGRLVKEKGVDVLLRAFAQLHRLIPHATLDVVGDGAERTSLEALSRSLGLHHLVRFHGAQSRAQTEAVACGAWVQVVPSVWAEPFGLVATEAMMRGTAVIASAAGGLTDIVRNEATGLLVRPGDETALRDALHRVLSDRVLAARWGRTGHDVAMAEYGHAQFVDRILAVYDRLLDASRAELQ